MNDTSWSVHASPVGRTWHVRVEGLDGATQARSAKEIDEMARDFIAVSTEAEASSINLTVSYDLPREIDALIQHAAELRAHADLVRKEAAVESRQAARALYDMGLTVRDVGAALGISHQRAQQLITG
jgi:hypothetical protein